MKILSFALLVLLGKDSFQNSLDTIQNPQIINSNHKIIGGSATTIERYPYTVQVLGFYSQYNLWYQICAGTILTRYHVMSAAHCFMDFSQPSLVNIRAGSSFATTGGTIHRVSTITVHPQYGLPALNNDIAILTLLDPITYSSSAQAGTIPPQGYEAPDNTTVTHVGWGATSVGGAGSAVLMEVDVYTINRTTCTQRYTQLQQLTGYLYPVTENMICAGVLDVGGRDACQGDSGGPLILGTTVIGITSWGEGCANATYPGVSTRVSSYTNWIQQTVNTTLVSDASSIATNSFVSILALFVLFILYA